jgi:hypothetical protein
MRVPSLNNPFRPESVSSGVPWTGEMTIGALVTCDRRVCDDTVIEVERTPIGCREYASDEHAGRGCGSARRMSR